MTPLASSFLMRRQHGEGDSPAARAISSRGVVASSCKQASIFLSISSIGLYISTLMTCSDSTTHALVRRALVSRSISRRPTVTSPASAHVKTAFVGCVQSNLAVESPCPRRRCHNRLRHKDRADSCTAVETPLFAVAQDERNEIPGIWRNPRGGYAGAGRNTFRQSSNRLKI
jgi:hypothetical protein